MKFIKHTTIKLERNSEISKKIKENLKSKISVNFNNNSKESNNNNNNNNNEIEKLDIKKEKYNFQFELDLKKNKPLNTKRIIKIIYKNLFNYNKNLNENYDIMIINNLLKKNTLINTIYNELLLNIDECEFVEREFNLIESKNKIKFLGIINNYFVKIYPNYLKFPENYLNLINNYLIKKQKLIKYFDNKILNENKKKKNKNEISNYSFIKNLSISSLNEGKFNDESDDFFVLNKNNKNNEFEKQEEKSFQNIQKLIKIIDKNLKKRQKKIEKKKKSLAILNIKNEDDYLELEYLNKNKQISSDSSSENENSNENLQKRKVKKFCTQIVNHTNPKKMENILNKIILISKNFKKKTKNKPKQSRNNQNLNSFFKTEINDRTKKIFAKTSKFILKNRNDDKKMNFYKNSIKNYFQNLPTKLISNSSYKPLIFNKKNPKNESNNKNQFKNNNKINFTNPKLKVVYSYTKIQPHYSIEKNKQTKQLLINTEGYSTEMTTTKNLSNNVIYNIKKTYHLLNKKKQKSVDFSNNLLNSNNNLTSSLFFYNSMFNSDNNVKYYLNERRKKYEIERNYEINLKKFPYKNINNIDSKYFNNIDQKSLSNNNNNNIKTITKYKFKRPSNFSDDRTTNTQNSQSNLSNKTSIVKNIKFFVPDKRKAQSSYGRYNNNFNLSSNHRKQYSISGFGALKIYGFN